MMPAGMAACSKVDLVESFSRWSPPIKSCWRYLACQPGLVPRGQETLAALTFKVREDGSRCQV